MTLEKLQADMITAMKNKDGVRKRVLSSLVSAVKNNAIENKCKDNVPEDLVNQTILKCKKVVQEMIDTCPENRTDILDLYKKEFNIVNEYAPVLLDNPSHIETLVKELDIELIKKNMGIIMKELKVMSVDMKVAKDVVTKLLK